MEVFFQFKQHRKIKIKMYVAPPNETADTGVLKENIGHGVETNCSAFLQIVVVGVNLKSLIY